MQALQEPPGHLRDVPGSFCGVNGPVFGLILILSGLADSFQQCPAGPGHQVQGDLSLIQTVFENRDLLNVGCK